MRKEKRIESLELPQQHTRLRMILMIAALAVAVGAFAFALFSLLNGEPGWQVVEGDTSGELSFCDEFTLRYELGASGARPAQERRALVRVYSQAQIEAWRYFSPTAAVTDEHPGLSWLNAHPNTEVELPPALWQALSDSAASGRWLFLGPIAEMQDALVRSGGDLEAAAYDPRKSPEMADFVREALRWIPDETAIRLELEEGNRACLRISDECLAFGENWGVTRWIDFHWLRNAWVADYLAEALSRAGRTRFVLYSKDGFARIGSDEGGLTSVLPDGTQAVCRGKATLAVLQANRTGWTYRYADGERRTSYLSVEDGLDHCPADCLAAASRERNCAALARALQPLITRESLSGDELRELTCAWALVKADTIVSQAADPLTLIPLQ
ncbi:MAG: hypothetical protein IKH38_02535 [Clostridia bacterium]|nr:hypothetical protein [Clostridia bacterium]